MTDILVWLAKVVSAALLAGFLFSYLTDAPQWFTTFAAIWLFDKLDSKEPTK